MEARHPGHLARAVTGNVFLMYYRTEMAESR